MEYKMQMRTATCGIPWEHDFTMASDQMALDYVKRQITMLDNLPRSCMSVILWRMDEQKFLGEFGVEQTVTIREIKGR